MNSSQKNFLRRVKQHETTGLIGRIAETYAWHMNDDPIYFVDREAYRVDQKRTRKVKRILEKLENGGDALRANDPMEYDFLQNALKQGGQKTANNLKAAYSYFGFDIDTPKLSFIKNNDRRIPLKAGLILYAYIKKALNHPQILIELRQHLDPIVLHPELSGGLLREYILYLGSTSWNFNDAYLPYPIDDNSCGKNGWAHRYSQVLERSIFKGAIEKKEKLIEIGRHLAFGPEAQYRSLLSLGAKHKHGITPPNLVCLYDGKIPDVRCHDYIGMNKHGEFDKLMRSR